MTVGGGAGEWPPDKTPLRLYTCLSSSASHDGVRPLVSAWDWGRRVPWGAEGNMGRMGQVLHGFALACICSALDRVKWPLCTCWWLLLGSVWGCCRSFCCAWHLQAWLPRDPGPDRQHAASCFRRWRRTWPRPVMHHHIGSVSSSFECDWCCQGRVCHCYQRLSIQPRHRIRHHIAPCVRKWNFWMKRTWIWFCEWWRVGLLCERWWA